MQFQLTDEQKLIQDAVAEAARHHGDSARVRTAIDSPLGYDAATWTVLSKEMGLAGLLVPENCGGQALGLVELVVVFEQLGRFLIPSPLLETAVLSASLLGAAGTRGQKLLEGIAGGEVRIATAELVGNQARFVPGAQHADVLLIVSDQSLRAVHASAPGQFDDVEIEPLTMLDQTRPLAHVNVANANVGAELLAGSPVTQALARATDRTRIAIAAEAIGASAECLSRTVAYSQERQQFGRTIGSFQAVKHQAADMMIALEAAISAVYYGACAGDENPAELPEMAALAKVQASEALTFCASRMVQLHGGIGFTWEHDAHLYFKRARGTQTLLGTNQALDERLASAIVDREMEL